MTDCRKTDETSIGTGLVKVLMNVWCYTFLLLWTLFGFLLFPFIFCLLLFFLRWSVAQVVRWLIWMYGRGWLLLMSPFVAFRRENLQQIKCGEPSLLVVNHLSFFDTYCAALLPVHDITFAVRSWPFKMFWYSGFMRLARYLDVEGNSWQETLRHCQSAFSAGGTVLFFPEGHRSRDGELQRFYSGAFIAAINTGVPLIPLCIDGTNHLLPPGRRLLSPCTIRLRALEPIDVSEFREKDGHLRLRKLVKTRMAAALAEMRNEGVCDAG